MALLHLLYVNAKRYSFTLSALNCEHGLRGETSVKDSEFVRKWCEEHSVPLAFFKRSGVIDRDECSARLWRLKCFAAARFKNAEYKDIKATAIYPQGFRWEGAHSVATAHHLDDNAETVLFNLARGCALSGAEGITDGEFETEDGAKLKLIRPLVGVSRNEIDEYVRANAIPYVDDETNFSDDYTRNKLRHNVMPALEAAVPNAAKAIYRFSRLAADDEEYFDRLIKERGLIKNTRLGCEIAHCKEKVIFKRAVIKALTKGGVKDYTSEHAATLYELQFAEKGKKFEFLGFTAFKEDGRIAICDTALLHREKDGILFKEHFGGGRSLWNDAFIYITDGLGLDEHLLAFEAAAQDDERVPKKFRTLKFDGGAVPDGAVIRFMREGDKFTKFGGGTKNLGDYFTDKKIPVRIRRQIPLVALGNEILAVGGVEISDKIKITEDTENTLYVICSDYAALYNEGENK